HRRLVQVLGVELEGTRHASTRKLFPLVRGLNKRSPQVEGLALPRATSVQEESATERVQAVRKGGVVERVALPRAGDVEIVNEATTVAILLAVSLSLPSLISSRFSDREGGVMDCDAPSAWFWRRWGMPARRNMGRIEVCCQSNRQMNLQSEPGDHDTKMLSGWKSGWRM
ncbi:hypothetical protein C0991_004612, partial [Blastosporella zonata]